MGKIQTHIPVMLAEVLDTFQIMKKGFFLDATLGDGGHAESLLQNHEQIQLIGFDRDLQAVRRAEQRLARFANRCRFVNACFNEVGKELDELGVQELGGALFDLGVSSNQLDDSTRGFSYRTEGNLDMRMDQGQSLSADEIINKWNEEDIANILYEYGDERNSRRIAKAIVEHRNQYGPISTTIDLAEIISRTNFSKRTHPARRSFQALRIYVNQELEHIAPALSEVRNRLVVGGRVVVLAYHSGEDRIVKGLLKEWDVPSSDIHCLHRKVKKPSQTETAENPKSRSARMRSFEKRELVS